MTLTTGAFDPSRSWRFATCSCKPMARGHILISYAACCGTLMSGTHGYCGARVGAVATREQRFAEEDRALADPVTADNKTIVVAVHDFNTSKLPAPDHVSAAMTKLNKDIGNIVAETPGTPTFLLAYCCSAGTK
ncbi:hypothetical protein VSR34_37495 [Paraburkholderia sp. JHI2823]|uniref:hypothetical protein n=1 Tax=Paraburkholderia sp. JHI2823 TaxID=3112960 RepID=UPI00318151AC